jgi:hypothetical protein
MKPTAIYLFRSEELEGLYKVGLSDAIARRKVQVRDHYQLGAVVEAEAWFPTRSAAYQAEHAWHQFLAPLREDSARGREWFHLSDQLIQQFKRWADLSPSGLPLRFAVKSGRLTPFHAEQLTNKLLRGIPTNGRREVSQATRLRR